MKLSWGDNVERSQVREEGLVGTLFLPEKTPAPAIITIFGGVNRWITFVAIFLFSLIDFVSTLPFHLVHDQYIRWSRGSVPEDRAALLASKGFVTLALAFFGVDHLPKVLFEIMIRIMVLITLLLLIAQIYSDLDLEYFERALDWVLAREEVCGDNGAGLQGISQVELSKCILV